SNEHSCAERAWLGSWRNCRAAVAGVGLGLYRMPWSLEAVALLRPHACPHTGYPLGDWQRFDRLPAFFQRITGATAAAADPNRNPYGRDDTDNLNAPRSRRPLP